MQVRLIKMGKILLFAIFLIGLSLRIPGFDYPISHIFIWGDGTRDYLVANHILKYHEFPLAGPYNIFYESGILNSPLYFYLLAAFLFPFNHILSLSFINIILQMVTMALIFHIGKKIFNKNTATLAIIFYSLNPKIIEQADFLWQPTLMQPVVLLSLYFLINAQKSLLLMMISLMLLSLALTIHNSALPWLPLFLILTFFKLKERKKVIYYFAALSIIPLSLAIFHLPLIFYYLNNAVFKFGINDILNVKILYRFLSNLLENFTQFFQIFNLNIITGLIILALILTIRTKRNFFSFSLFILPFIAASFLSKVRMHYLTLSFPIFVLISANFAVNFFQKNRVLRIGLIALMILVLSNSLSAFWEVKKPLENYNLVMKITDDITQDLQKIKADKKYKNYDFFQVNSLMDNNGILRYPVLDTLFLAPLEEKLNTKLVSLSNTSPYHHIQTNNREYLIIPCIKISLELCQDEFIKSNLEYSLIKVFYSGRDFSVLFAKLSSI